MLSFEYIVIRLLLSILRSCFVMRWAGVVNMSPVEQKDFELTCGIADKFLKQKEREQGRYGVYKKPNNDDPDGGEDGPDCG